MKKLIALLVALFSVQTFAGPLVLNCESTEKIGVPKLSVVAKVVNLGGAWRFNFYLHVKPLNPTQEETRYRLYPVDEVLRGDSQEYRVVNGPDNLGIDSATIQRHGEWARLKAGDLVLNCIRE